MQGRVRGGEEGGGGAEGGLEGTDQHLAAMRKRSHPKRSPAITMIKYPRSGPSCVLQESGGARLMWRLAEAISSEARSGLPHGQACTARDASTEKKKKAFLKFRKNFAPGNHSLRLE